MQISVSSTLLGRARIVATSQDGYREIIVNPRTGEILRDVWLSLEGTSGPLIVGSDDNISPEDDDDNDDKGNDSDGDKGRGRGEGTNGGGDD